MLFFRGCGDIGGGLNQLERDLFVFVSFLVTVMADEIYDVFMMRRIGLLRGERDEDHA
jgi:hypothetical protein